MVQAIAVDDEPVALDIIRRHTAGIPYLNLLATFTDARAGFDFMAANRVDLIFLDIQMPGMNGLDLARRLSPEVQVVFVTAHADYAIDGFELAATDFLLKPINQERLVKATSLVLRRAEQKGTPQSIFIKDGYNLVRIDLARLLYVRADDNYLNFIESSRYTLSRMKMNDLEKKMPSNFQRVHKSYLVNLDAIEGLQNNRILIGKVEIPVSRSVLPELKAKLSASS
jgi:two-component system LytT family response regulator